MPVWISSTSAARRHAAYAISRTPSATIKAIGTGVAAIIAAFPWGPTGTLVDTPSGAKDLISKIAPPGMDHLNSAYMSAMFKAFPTLKIVRAVGGSALQATSALTSAGPVTNATVTAKYNGAAGNSLVAVVANAGDGVAGHFKLTVSITGASGNTAEVVDNVLVAGGIVTASGAVLDFSKYYLIGAIAPGTNGRPDNGTYTFASGSDGTINTASYTGTAGTGNQGIAALEGDSQVRHVFTDDPGNTNRAAINTALQAHAIAMGDRFAYLNGPTGQTAAQAQTDASSYRSNRVVYVDPWVYCLDDVTGAKRLVPSAPFAASVASQVSPSTSIAWKDPEVMAMLGNVFDLEADRGQAAADNSDAGICTVIREENGGHTFEAGVLTIAPNDPAQRNHTRMRIGDYAAVSMVRSSRSFIDAPNVPANQQNVIGAVTAFMEKLKAAKDSDPNHAPHCLDYSIPPLAQFNSQSDLDNGSLTIPVDMKTSSGIERLFFSFRFGESVTVKAS